MIDGDGDQSLDAALRRNGERVELLRSALYGSALTVADAAKLLGIDEGAVDGLVAGGELCVVDGADGARLPAWQFTSGGRLDGIGRVGAAFPGRVLGLSAWMVAANPALEGRSPVDALRDGDVDLVVTVAAHLMT